MAEPPLNLSRGTLSHMLLLLINIIFMLGCQQTIENNTKYLVIPWVFPFCFQPLSQCFGIGIFYAFCSRYSLPSPWPLFQFPLGLVPEILCIFIIVLLSLFRVFVFLLPRESQRLRVAVGLAGKQWGRGRGTSRHEHSFGLGRYAYLPFVCASGLLLHFVCQKFWPCVVNC